MVVEELAVGIIPISSLRALYGDCGGIDFRETNNSAGYFFLVRRTGAYALYLGTRSGQSILIARVVSPFIASGLQAENLMGVVANGRSKGRKGEILIPLLWLHQWAE